LGGRKDIRPLKNLSGGVLAWLSVWYQVRFAYGPADATATHYLLLQYRLVLPFWYQLTRVVLEKFQKDYKTIVVVVVVPW